MAFESEVTEEWLLIAQGERPWKWEEDGYTVIRANARTAPGCHNNCGILIYVKDGKVAKVEGDKENPYNQGRLCSRCLALPDYVYHPDRLLYPMKRDRGDRGKDKFVRITWDEAYDIIEKNLKEIQGKYGPECFMTCQGTGRDIHQITRLNACTGSPNEGVPYFAGNSCYLPRIASMACMLGDAALCDCSQFLPLRYDDPEYEVPEVMIIWGHSPFYANADGFFGHWVLDLMKRGTKLIVVDPDLSWVAARAGEHWLRLRPGSDGALAMAMLKVIFEEDLYDHDYCDKWVYGVEQVKARCDEYDLDFLSERCWVPKEDIIAAARLYAGARRATIQWGVALDQQSGGQQAAHAVTSLWTITGNLDMPGGNVSGPPCWGISQPNWTGCWGYDELMTDEEASKRIGTETYPLFNVGFKNLSSNATFKAWETGLPYRPRCAWFATSNWLACMGAQTKRQLVDWYNKYLEFVVVADLFMTPTMMALADVVLPACTFLERNGFGGLQAYYISSIVKAVEPLGETRADQTMFREIGKRVCLPRNKEIAYPWDDDISMWDYALEQGGFTWDELKRSSWKYPKFEYRKFEKGLMRADGQMGFETPTGRADIYCMVFHYAGQGLDPLPAYVEPLESPYSCPQDLKDYPLLLTTGLRTVHFFHSEHRQIKRLRALHPEPLCYINPETAKAYGIGDGEWFYIENKHGIAKYKASYKESYDPRVIATDHAWWFPERLHTGGHEYETGLFGVWESNCNNMVPLPCGVSGFGGNYKCMMVRIKRLDDIEYTGEHPITYRSKYGGM